MNDSNERPRILIVDDERLNLSARAAALNGDHKVIVAMNGEQALKAVQVGRPDLILLDVNMPGLDGYEVCRRLKADEATQGIPIIFITALSDAADETRGLDIGAVDYIVKPFNIAVVRARVRTHLRLKQQADLLERYAFRDGLTGLNNRRAFDEKRTAEWQRCLHAGLPLSAIILDVDHFKLFNDHYGHGAGDECLARVAKALAACMTRSSDMVARYGGEEFAAVLPDTHHDEACRIAEEFRGAVAAMSLLHATSKTAEHVTISVGVATVVPTDATTLKDLGESADAALYRAKQTGRNRVCGASS